MHIKIKRDKTKFALFKGLRNSAKFWFWNPESEKNLLVESWILDFGIRNTAQGIRNPTNDLNPKSKFQWQRLESSSCLREGCLGFPYMGQMRHILPPLLNRYAQDNNVNIWARGPAKPPCPLFNIYADMYKYQVLSINKRTDAPKPDTKTPQKTGRWKKHGERVPPTKAVVQPLGF